MIMPVFIYGLQAALYWKIQCSVLDNKINMSYLPFALLFGATCNRLIERGRIISPLLSSRVLWTEYNLLTPCPPFSQGFFLPGNRMSLYSNPGSIPALQVARNKIIE